MPPSHPWWSPRRLLGGGGSTGAPGPADFWALSPEALLGALGSSREGLSREEAAARLRRYGPNQLMAHGAPDWLRALYGQVKSPLVLLLFGAAILSGVAREWTDVAVILAILALSILLGFIQEFRAGRAVQRLKAGIAARARVLRGGETVDLPVSACVPGDVVLLSAGSLIPADAAVLEAKDCFVSEAVLTGETFPVEKRPGATPAGAALAERSNVLYLGTSVRSGTARAVVVRTGAGTEYGALSGRLALRAPETDFDRGIRHFGYLLLRVIGALVFVVLAASLARRLPAWEALLFAIALAVGLAPEMLPAILSVTLAHGARRMAKGGVVVRRLSAIENFGCMDVFCTDKTGTLTEGLMRFQEASGADGCPDEEVLRLGYWNAAQQTGMLNPIDEALRSAGARLGAELPAKIDEIPYDFTRKRMTVIVADPGGGHRLICKGAVEPVLGVCAHLRRAGAETALTEERLAELRARYLAWSTAGIRVLALATRRVSGNADGHTYQAADERDLTLEGFLLFVDPPKAGVSEVVRSLRALGVTIKIITGDHHAVAIHVAREVGLSTERVVTGRELQEMRDEALWHLAERASIFAEVDPNQKERIISALQKTGHVVGYMGDGINDAPALHAADVGVSVSTAVDVAREAADFVLVGSDLDTLRAGIEEGRATFANTLKYILTTESANFGNMLSMAAAALFLPYLPLLAPQVLLNNFLSDIPAMAIPLDAVDADWVARPHRWDLRLIRRFMLLFGGISTFFDLLTFYSLHVLLGASPELFRTSWFVESLLTELLVALVVRTRLVSWRSRPSAALLYSTAAVAALAVAVPFSPLARAFQFVPLPGRYLALILGITLAYVVTVEAAKRWFYRGGGPAAGSPRPR